MSENIYDDPDFKAWEDDVIKGLVPKISGSDATVSLVPKGKTDAKFAVELGFSIMLDKPILAIVDPGAVVPERLRRVADKVIVADLTTDEGKALVQREITSFMAALE